MADARGIYILHMDSKGRIFANKAMIRFFGPPEFDGAGIWCLIGPPLYGEKCTLIILNDYYANDLSHRNRDVNIRAERDSEAWKIDNLFYQTEIKSMRVQFIKAHRVLLDLPDDDNRVVIQGQGYCFLVWPVDAFKQYEPDLYSRLVDGDEEENE